MGGGRGGARAWAIRENPRGICIAALLASLDLLWASLVLLWAALGPLRANRDPTRRMTPKGVSAYYYVHLWFSHNLELVTDAADATVAPEVVASSAAQKKVLKNSYTCNKNRGFGHIEQTS